MVVVNTNAEISRLRDLMPASGRMKIRLLLDDRQSTVIHAPFPRPWQRSHAITLNYGLWQGLSAPQRDLLFLRYVCWVLSVQVLKPQLYQGITVAGTAAALFELTQGDLIGVLGAGGLSAIAAFQVWRNNTGTQAELAADEEAIRVAQRRGYDEPAALRHLISAIEAVPIIEGRGQLNFSELMRVQNLRGLAGQSPLSTPERTRSR